MNATFAYVFVAIASGLAIFWGSFYLKAARYYEILRTIDTKQFFLPGTYGVGMAIIATFSIKLQSTYFIKKLKKIEEIYGSENADFYQLIMVSGQISYASLLTVISFCLGALSNDIYILVLGLVGTLCLVFYFDYSVSKAVSKRRAELLEDLPHVVSKLAMLVNAGLVLREAWEKVAKSGEGCLYQEMRQTTISISNGMVEVDAFNQFAKRCVVKEIRKFTSMITQNLQKGSDSLSWSLRELADESWEVKKNQAKRKGELAGQKLLLPIAMMFIGILFMIIVPVFAGMF